MHRFAATCLVALAGLVATAVAPSAAAADACRIGDIVRTFGEVSLVRAGQSAAAQPGQSVCVGDHVVTGARGVAELKFGDGTEVTVGKDSEFAVSRWRERWLFANQAGFELVRGAFRALTGSMTQRRHVFEVRTTIATIGVRGTEFWGGMNLAPGTLDVIMLEGKGVYVVNDAGRVELQKAGTGTTVTAGGTPSAPQAWAPEKLQRAVGTITP